MSDFFKNSDAYHHITSHYHWNQVNSLVILINCIISPGNAQRHKPQQEAWLWPGEDKIGMRLKYSDTVDWSDLWSLMNANGFYTVGEFCVRGAFIMYNKPFFAITGSEEFDIISGFNQCTAISENTKSIQLIGSAGYLRGSSITFFERSNFGSEAFPTIVNVGSAFFQKMEYTQSAIIMGNTPWTIELENGEKYCLLPDFDPKDEQLICLIKDFTQLLSLTEDTRVLLKRATQGCADITDKESIQKIQDCLYWGKRDATQGKNLIEDDKKVSPKGRSMGGGSQGVCADEESKKQIFEAYKISLDRDLNTIELIGWPKDIGKNGWKLEFLDVIFGVVLQVIPDDIISNEFLTKARELFIRKLATAWKRQDSNDTPISERDYRSLISMTEQCLEVVTDSPDDVSLEAVAKFRQNLESIYSLDAFDSLVDPEFKRIPKLDVITEIVWLVGHMAGYWCHAEYMDKTYFWALYFKTFLDMYMTPVASEWTKPTAGLNFIFGGYDYKLEYEKLAAFTTLAKDSANDLEPLERPSSLGLENIKEPSKAPQQPSDADNENSAPTPDN